jgi:Protein of unknown function DUF262/Protein of unknown function (DUF1524)
MDEFISPTVQVGQLFANPYFIEAPVYQRSFAWTEKEVCRLLDAVAAAVDGSPASRDNSDYFLGTMVFIEREQRAPSRITGWPRSRASRLLDVVDGFQRLTTLTILFCVLRDMDAQENQPLHVRVAAAIGHDQGANARQRLLLGDSDEAFFQAYVRAPNATQLSPEEGKLSPTERRILDARGYVIAALKGYDAAERRRFADFLLDRCRLVFVATKDIDGAHRIFMVLNATGKPLARNDILKADLLAGMPLPARQQAAQIWAEAERRLGDDFEQLFSHIRIMYERPDSRVIQGIRQIAADNGGALAFIERVLQPATRIADDIVNARHTGSSHSAAVVQYLRYLGWHSFSDWIPPAMLWWLEKGQDPARLRSFLAKLDRLAFGVRLMGIGASKRVHRFAAVVSSIRRGRDLDASDSPLAFSRQELRTMQYNLRNVHGLNASTAKHLLMRLTDARAGRPESAQLPNRMTVEHVLPKKLGAGSAWRTWFADPTEREHCTDCLGNLVLVTKEQNDRASNLGFARKLDIYFNSPGEPIPAINADLRGRTEWRAHDIRGREANLFHLIEELWQFGIATPRAQAAE